MNRDEAIGSFAALAQETRLEALRLLLRAAPEGMPAGDVASRLGTITKSVSGHLGELAEAGLVRAEGAGREARYAADVETIRGLFGFLMAECCAGRPELCALEGPREAMPFDKIWAAGRRFNLLFLCTHNSARSIMAEAIVNHDHGARFRAFSAGSHPSGEVSPDALALLERLGYPVEGLHSKDWDQFTAPEAPEIDFVFTLCDEAANETCPVWPGAPMTAHWGVPDPKAATGDATARRLAHLDAFRMLERRIGIFANLPFASLERAALRKRMAQIGADDPAATERPA